MASAADPTGESIRAALAALQPLQLRIRNDSHLHAGHAGARAGGGHYHIEIESAAFVGRTPVARHRQIHAVLGHLMGSAIHALAIQAWAPGEAAAAQASSTTPKAKESR